MNNPVPPPDGTYPPPRQGEFPAQREGGYQPEGQGGYPAGGRGGYPAAGQGDYPAEAAWGSQGPEGQGGYPAPAQPGYPAPRYAQPGFASQPPPPGEAKTKGGPRRVIVLVGLVVLALVVVGVARFALLGDGDQAQDAKTGDCIASDEEVADGGNTKTGAKIVDCGSPDAKFTVVARVNGETDVESKACDNFFKPDEHFYRYASDAGGGYLLCLRPKA